MHEAFRTAIDDCVACITARAPAPLAAVYLVGSVARGEAVPGLSDVNLLAVFHGEGTPLTIDSEWLEEITAAVEGRHPELGLRQPDDPETGMGSFPLVVLGAVSLAELQGGSQAARDTGPEEGAFVEARSSHPEPPERPRDDLLELQWGGRLLWGEELRGEMPSCPVPRLANAREWTARASLAVMRAAADLAYPRRAGHALAKAALQCCLAVSIAEGDGFTLESDLIAGRFGERHPEWAAWAKEFARARVDPPTMPERLAGLLEAARILVDWSETILHTIGRAHPLRC
jgi:hypothetical protein